MITLPGQAHVVVWDESAKVSRKKLPQADAIKWRGCLFSDASPPRVEIRKQCSLYPYSKIRIVVTLGEQEFDGMRLNGYVTISASKEARLTLLEASDFSLCMIEAIKTLRTAEERSKGELHGIDSNGGL